MQQRPDFTDPDTWPKPLENLTPAKAYKLACYKPPTPIRAMDLSEHNSRVATNGDCLFSVLAIYSNNLGPEQYDEASIRAKIIERSERYSKQMIELGIQYREHVIGTMENDPHWANDDKEGTAHDKWLRYMSQPGGQGDSYAIQTWCLSMNCAALVVLYQRETGLRAGYQYFPHRFEAKGLNKTTNVALIRLTYHSTNPEETGHYEFATLADAEECGFAVQP